MISYLEYDQCGRVAENGLLSSIQMNEMTCGYEKLVRFAERDSKVKSLK